MFSCLFMSTQQLFAAADTSCQASTETASPVTGFFKEFGLDQAIADAFWEGALALVVFGAASVMISSYRRRKTQSNKPQKVKLPPHVPQHPAASVRTNTRLPSCSARMAAVAAATGRPDAAPAPRQSQPVLPAKSPSTEADALVRAVKAGKAASLPQLLDKALARASVVANSTATAEEMATALLNSSLRACAANHCFSDAIAAYEHVAARIGGGNSGLWSILLYCIVEARTFDSFQQVFDNLCKLGAPSEHDFVNMVRCYALGQDAKGLRKTLASLCAAGQFVEGYTWNRALASCGSSESALSLSEALVDSGICREGLDGVGYNTLMKYNAHAGKFSRCFELNKEMLAKGIEASEVTFGILLDACVAAKDLVASKKVFDDLCSSQVRLNVVHCTTFIKSLLAASDLDGAATVLREMAGSSGVKPDLITYSTVIKAYADAGDVRGGLKILQEMITHEVKPDELIFNCLLAGCSVCPVKSADIMQTFETLRGLGLRPSTTTLSIMLKGLAQTQAWTASLQLLTSAPHTLRLEPEARLFVQLAQSCVKSRAVAETEETFNAMLDAVHRRRERPDPGLVSRVLRSCQHSGESRLAAQLHETAERAGATGRWHEEKASTMCTSKPRSTLEASPKGMLSSSNLGNGSVGPRPWMKGKE